MGMEAVASVLKNAIIESLCILGVGCHPFWSAPLQCCHSWASSHVEIICQFTLNNEGVGCSKFLYEDFTMAE